MNKQPVMTAEDLAALFDRYEAAHRRLPRSWPLDLADYISVKQTIPQGALGYVALSLGGDNGGRWTTFRGVMLVEQKHMWPPTAICPSIGSLVPCGFCSLPTPYSPPADPREQICEDCHELIEKHQRDDPLNPQP